MNKEVLILSTTPAGIQAAFDLADFGLQVNLVEEGPFIGETIGNDNHLYLKNTRLLDLLKHPRIRVWTNSELLNLEKTAGGFQVDLHQSPRYIDLEKCTACGDCLEVCPITIPGTDRKAIYFSGQPDCAVIAKVGVSPCSNACPAGIHVQGYVALIEQGRYREAYGLIHDALPFPSVCGRVCNHYCEEACTRSQLDGAVNLMALKRFVADWAYKHQEELKEVENDRPHNRSEKVSDTAKKVAIIGAGPAGLTAARDLVRKGHVVKVFDNNPIAGGMMRVGIPPHRLPYLQLDWEIEQILLEGVDLQLNTWVDDIPGLLENGFDAVLIATGAHLAVKGPIEGADHPDNWLSLDFLKKACLGEDIDLSGRKVIVLGGGDVAMDAARVAIRLGTSDVRVVCRGMRASFTEIQEAEEEGVELISGRVFQRIILENGDIHGVECLEAEVGEIVGGKRQFTELPGTEHLIPGDLVIWALGQSPDLSFLPKDEKISLFSQIKIQADSSMMTTMKGVFIAGDVHRGTTFFVVDAVGEGHRVAQSIDLFLNGISQESKSAERIESKLSREIALIRLNQRETAGINRAEIPHLSIIDRANNFSEVDLTLKESVALQEAGRCLACGPCSECLACVEVCKPGAVILDQRAATSSIQVCAVIADDSSLPVPRQDLIMMESSDPQAGSASAFQVMEEIGFIDPDVKLGDGLRSSGDLLTGKKAGLIVCQCGGVISSLVDTAGLCLEALSWPEIDFAAELPFSCTAEGSTAISRIAQENNLDKIILAACSCCSLDQVCYSCTYQRLRCKDNLGIYKSLSDSLSIDFVNLREQCAWAHPRNKKKTTAAARILISSALARTSGKINRKSDPANIPNSVLILGKGASAKYCQDSLAKLGFVSEITEVMGGDIIRTGGHFQADWPDNKYRADCLVMAPGSGAELDHLSKSLFLSNHQPLLADAQYSLDTIDFGLIICSPGLPPEVSGRGAAARLIAWINKISDRINQPTATVDPIRCRTCGTCQEICGYGIPRIIETGEINSAYINPLLCFDCGTCTAHCPSGAITPGTLSEIELEQMLEKILV